MSSTPANNLALPNWVRRLFVVVWLILGVWGALNHNILPKWFGSRTDLLLPHLRYGHVMFNKNMKKVKVFKYQSGNGEPHYLADLVTTPSLGYHRARLGMNVLLQPRYIDTLCRSAQDLGQGQITILIEEYDVSDGPAQPTKTTTRRCY